MRVDRNARQLVLRGEDDQALVVRYANRGEPYREGVELSLEEGYNSHARVFLDEQEGCSLRNLLNTLFPSGVVLSAEAQRLGMTDDQFVAMVPKLIRAAEDAVANLGAWLTDNTEDVFEEQPEIDDVRAKLQDALWGDDIEPFFIPDETIRQILKAKDVGSGRALIMKAIGR